MKAKRLTWDENKRESNLAKHKLDFAHVVDFDTESALIWEDRRGETDPKFLYRERRFIALGLMRGKVVVIVFAPTGQEWRIISVRAANSREQALWLRK